MQRILLMLATGFGLGYSPFAPGTVGCLWGLPLAWALQAAGQAQGLGWPSQVVAAALLSLLAIPICAAGEKAAGTKDPRCVVADEYLTFPISLIGLPFSPLVVAGAFVTNRLCDILKPFPARQLQRLDGGLGIVIDDVFSALYSLALNHALYRLVLHSGWLA
ncbi:MAG: phosphatidylglycerophosphatase A [Kiritimatiellaeota bacterium]|nr:phosphatidylglycerophosphatase A [Kiritimatiellota bacterium]